MAHNKFVFCFFLVVLACLQAAEDRHIFPACSDDNPTSDICVTFTGYYDGCSASFFKYAVDPKLSIQAVKLALTAYPVCYTQVTRLYFNDTLLDNDAATLGSYHIQDGDEIIVICLPIC